MDKKCKTIVLIDGNALIHRAYHALPPLTSKSGELVNAVYGFTLTLLSVLEKFHPEYIAASFDLAGPTFRHEKSADYKATRVKAPDDLYAQIPRVKEMTRAFNIPIYELAGFEADDCIGTLARQAEAENVRVIIVTGDSDELQLVTPLVNVFMLRKGIKDIVLYDEKAVMEKYGFGAKQLPDYKGLAGDSSDNISGVAGIGAKTATDLLQKFGSVENIYAHLEEVKDSVRKKLEVDRESAFLSKELGTIDIHAPITLDLSACVTKDFDRNVVSELLRELGFFSLIKRISGTEEVDDKNNPSTTLRAGKKIKVQKISTKEELEKFLGKTKEVSVYVKQGEGTLFGVGIDTIHIALDELSEAVVFWNEETKIFLQTFLEDETRKKIVYDGKHLMHLLKKEHILFRGMTSDIMLSAYLLRSGGNVDLSHIVLEEFGEEEILFPAQKILLLQKMFQTRIDEVSATQTEGKTLRTVLEQIELPLIPILYAMEAEGIILNTEKFQTLSLELTKELGVLERDIYTLSGREFNINSPKQLSVILFEDLHIPTTNIKKTKTGISTASPELQKLQEYPIIQKIENYRELFKLKTTYLDALPLLVDNHSRLHTTFYQTVAATGRLSSADPNVQNIPARNATRHDAGGPARNWGTLVRGAFEPGRGYVFVGADYSQVELRVMAHLSGDESLTSSFQKNEDVHTRTASVVFKVKPEEVTPDMRRQAKVFNFGIMYGMGAYGLAQSAKIDQKTAGEFIKAYFEKFAGVAQYIETMKENARERGFVETELGRRRYTPEITSSNVQVARAAERMAINMPVQGLAADIMKLAMIAVTRRIETDFRNSVKIVLQVHDELICEVKEDQAQAFADAIKETMEQAYPLSVPLTVETAIGKNWGEI
ncbi:MAG: DNA polymerase I [Candidatus Moranbacteria bacterium]|nr:DNA polymerase I [Candidatus Moranbacteria bacterium]MDD3964598.1 DNA polymerase I [Candidatus Moranbacteria bacterium]